MRRLVVTLIIIGMSIIFITVLTGFLNGKLSEPWPLPSSSTFIDVVES